MQVMWHCDTQIPTAEIFLFVVLKDRRFNESLSMMKMTVFISGLYFAVVTVTIITLTTLIHVMNITDKRWDIAGSVTNLEDQRQTIADSGSGKCIELSTPHPIPRMIYIYPSLAKFNRKKKLQKLERSKQK